ncbi:hypothetical protein [Streptomyces sp. NPDC048357]|uniref:hypothetical protein n=1 Tax=Streptomyces sp. NPDC048357 TaxID=3154719 RepID=UPI0034413A80
MRMRVGPFAAHDAARALARTRNPGQRPAWLDAVQNHEQAVAEQSALTRAAAVTAPSQRNA